jgi:transketolase
MIIAEQQLVASAVGLSVRHYVPSGVSYMRTTRGAYAVLYGPEETFPIGGAKVLSDGRDLARG